MEEIVRGAKRKKGEKWTKEKRLEKEKRRTDTRRPVV